MKKVLVITYYWPPSGGSGVQRWLKFIKYLPDFGWQPFVFTPENPSFEVKDQSLEADISPEVEVIRLPIWEPYSFLEKFKGKGSQQSDVVKQGKAGFVGKIMLWVRGNLFIPDPRRFWIKPAVKVLGDILTSNEIDTIITTGPPHSIHLIGLRLKHKHDIKWVADFRDPWTTWTLYDKFFLSAPARKMHQRMERNVLQQADAVIAASSHYAQELCDLGGRKVEVVTNGFDETEFETNSDEKPDKFIIRHVGVIDELRDPRPFLEAVKSLIVEDNYCIKVEFVGNVNRSLKEYITSDQLLKEHVGLKPYVDHNQVFDIYRSSAALLLVPFQNMPGNIPGKLFEYLAAQRPILYVGPEGDSADIIRSTQSGFVCDSDNIDVIKKAIKDLYRKFELGQYQQNQDISTYSRRNLTQKLAQILSDL